MWSQTRRTSPFTSTDCSVAIGASVPTRSVTTVVIGAGHAGLAMSRALSDRSVDHVVLERGSVAHSWKTERWDSLRLLTPNWLCQLPGRTYDGDDPDGFMVMHDVISFIEGYALSIDAPIITQTTVTSVRATEIGYHVFTNQGFWRCRTVVIATGACSLASVPEFAGAVPTSISTVTPTAYRNADQLADGGVLVVGASATGLQLAEEIHLSGRPVTLSVGNHVRLPRTYRGRDIYWWMHAAGVLSERYDEVDDIVRVRNVPSPQLIGTPDRRTLDVNALRRLGVDVRGRMGTIRDNIAMFSGGLRNQCNMADLKMHRLLDTIDAWSATNDQNGLDEPERPSATDVGEPPLTLDLMNGSIKTIVWATGFTPDYSWLDVAVVDHRGRIRHDGGVVDAPGMYVIGAPFLRRRNSNFIHGAGDDAEDLADCLVRYLAGSGRATA
jgi:putative flavoprotein involved in K+ transport